LKFRPNRLKPAAGRYNRIFAVFPSIRIGAIRRNIVKTDENLDSDKMQLRSHLDQWEVLVDVDARGRKKRKGSVTG
jgi:hypothetical protein